MTVLSPAIQRFRSACAEPRWRGRNRTYHRLLDQIYRFQIPEGARVRKELEEAKGAAVEATNRAQAAEKKAEMAARESAAHAADAERFKIRVDAMAQQLEENNKRSLLAQDALQSERRQMMARLQETEAKLAEAQRAATEKPASK